ncbi:MAG: DEAD/DEAH box helicase [Methanosarcinales archaeon]|nr:DEAD/DEAH box helicase [Methanosarcinales archaeon]
MRVLVADKLYLTDFPPNLTRPIKKKLTLPNPTYQVMLRKNKRACYRMKKDFKYYEQQDNCLVIGRGNLPTLEKYLIANNIDANKVIESSLKIRRLEDEFVSSNLTLRDYQVPVLPEILEHKQGVIKLSVGFGKTIISLKTIEHHKQKTLIIVPRNSILTQFKEEIKKYYNYDCGVIQGKIWNIKDVTVASISTLQKRNLDEIKNRFGCVIVDECHTLISEARLKVIQSFDPLYLYGLSGTPRRTDEQGEAIFFTFGNIVTEHSLPQKTPKVNIVRYDGKYIVEEYMDMVQTMVDDTSRNVEITRKTSIEIYRGRKVLILTKRIEHFEKIKYFLNNHKVYALSSKDKQKDRDELLKKLRNNTIEFNVIVGTYSMLSTGVDIPALDTIIFAGDVKSDVLTEQSVGRILRLFEGKKDPKVIDIHDYTNPIFHRQFLKRQQFYNKNNWEILK